AWKKDSTLLHPSNKYEIKQEGKIAKLVIHDVELGDAGEYGCETRDDHTCAVLKVKVLNVKDHCKCLENLKSCGKRTPLYSIPAINMRKQVVWKKDSTLLQPSDKYEIKQEGKIAKLIIHDVEPGDAGEYGCETRDDHTCAVLKVKPSDKYEIKQEGKIAKLIIHDVEPGDAGKYDCDTGDDHTSAVLNVKVWKKDPNLLHPSDKYEIKQEGKIAKLIIHDVEPGDAGKYDCDTGDDHTSAVLNVKGRQCIHPLIPIHTFTLYVHFYSTVTPVLIKEHLEVAWKKDSTLLHPSDKYEIKQEGKIAKLIIHDVEPGDAGGYVCDTGDDHTCAVLKVKGMWNLEMQGNMVVTLEMTTLVQFSKSKDHCKCLENLTVVWKKDSTLLHPSDKYEIKQEGKIATLIIHDVEPGDAGEYGCDTGDDHTCAVLKVKGVAWKKDSTLLQPSDKYEIKQEGKIEVVWKKDSTLLHPSDKYEIKQEGKIVKLIIHDVEPGDAGKYGCDTRDDHTCAVLKVKVAWKKYSTLLQPSVAWKKDSTLLHPSDKYEIKVVWKKDSNLLHPSDKYEIKQEGKIAKLIIHDVEPGDAGKYDCDTGDDHTSAVLNVKGRSFGKRTPLYSIPAINIKQEGIIAKLIIHDVEPGDAVAWKKDSTLLHPSDKYEIKQEGKIATLIIHDTEPGDAGKYDCDTGDDHTSAVLIVKEAPVLIREALRDQEALEFETLTLICRLSKPNAPLAWQMGSSILRSGEKYSLVQEGDVAKLTIYNLQMSDAGDYECDTGDDRTIATITVKGTRIIHLIYFHLKAACDDDEQLIHFEMASVAKELVWEKDCTVLRPSDKYEMGHEGNVAMLIVHDVQMDDAGEYRCDTGDENTFASLTVKEKPAVFTKGLEDVSVEERGDAVLLCELSKEGAPVSWLKDGRALGPDGRHEMSQEGRTARFVLHGLSLQDSGRYSCGTGHDVTAATLTVTENEYSVLREYRTTNKQINLVSHLCIIRAEPDICVEWWLGESPVRNNELNELFVDGREHTLILNNLTLQDSGTIRFQAGNAISTATLTVTKLPVRVVRPLQDVEVEEEQAVILECELSEEAADVAWRKDGHELEAGGCVAAGRDGNLVTLVVRAARPQDSGVYSCEAGAASSSATVHVRDLPVQVLEPLSDVTATEGGEASLRCSLSKPGTEVAWTKDSRPVRPGEKYDVGSEGLSVWLAVRALRLDDAGSYVCHVGDLQTTAILTVQEKPAVFTKGLEDVSVEERGDAVLLCELSKEGAPVSWLKDGRALGPDGRHEMSQEGRTARLVLHGLSLQDSGRYSCGTGHDVTAATLTVTELPVRVVQPLQDVEVEEEQAVILECELSEEAADVAWRKDGRELEAGGRVAAGRDGNLVTLIVRAARPQDSGVYSCEAGAASSSATVHVRELPLQILEPLIDQEATEGESARLSCRLSKPHASVAWSRGSQPLRDGDKFEPRADGHTAVLVIRDVGPDDAGTYTCRAGEQESAARLFVLATEKPAVFTKGLEDVSVEERGDAVLLCELSKEGAPVSWLKDGRALGPDGRHEMSQEGRTARFVLHGLSLQDSGRYSCGTGHDVTAATLTVTELPLRVVTPLEDVEVMSGEAATFSCELSRLSLSIQWSKDGGELGASDRIRLSLEGSSAVLEIQRAALGDSGVYTCATLDDSSSARLTVSEKVAVFIAPLEDVWVEERSRAVLSCELSRPDVDVVWLRGDVELEASPRASASRDGARAALAIAAVRTDDAGEYSCRTRHDRTAAVLVVTEFAVEITRPPADVEAWEGEAARFSCELSRADVEDAGWWLGEQPLGSNEINEVAASGATHALLLRDLAPHDNGLVTFRAARAQASARL
uniref:Ig-like domain-containing protein n=1 Tax=Petromyzon marinus TaxID=7757 RepID=S4RZ46_PETMA